MKRLIYIFVLALFVQLFPEALFAQTTGSIGGTVVDSNDGSPLIGAIIYLSDTNIVVETNENGRFEMLNIKPGIYSIKTKYIGYESKTIERLHVVVGKNTKIDFYLITGKICDEPLRIIRKTLDPTMSGRTFVSDWFNESIRR